MEKLSRLEAKYIALRWAYTWVSVPADTIQEDFYDEIPEHYLVDKHRLNELHRIFTDNETPTPFYRPSVEESLIIQKELHKLSIKLLRELKKIKNIYNTPPTKLNT